jgi:hypothetical protein
MKRGAGSTEVGAEGEGEKESEEGFVASGSNIYRSGFDGRMRGGPP